jgi:WD40 repeat protein
MTTRRQFLAELASTAAAAVLAGRLVAAEVNLISWPSRVVQLPDDEQSHKQPVVTAVRLHKEGQWLATAGDDHLVRVWNLTDGKLVHKLAEHTDWVRTVDYSPDGVVLASAGNDRQILLWDSTTGDKLGQFAAHQRAIAAIRFSHDGAKLAAVGFDGTIRLYEVATKQLLAESAAPCQDMRTVAFAPDNQLIAAAGRCGSIRLLTGDRGELVRDIAAHKQRVRAISFSPDGSYIASSGEDRLVHVQPLAEGRNGFTFPSRPSKVLALAFYGPTQLAVAGSDNLIRLWDVAEQRETGVLAGHTGTIAALECQGKVLISAGYDTTVRVWSIADHVASRPAAAPRVSRQPVLESLPRKR